MQNSVGPWQCGEETYAVRVQSLPLYHMRNGSDWESNLRPQRRQALMLITNIDLTTAPLRQPIIVMKSGFN
jgi:hypothetical protein